MECQDFSFPAHFPNLQEIQNFPEQTKCFYIQNEHTTSVFVLPLNNSHEKKILTKLAPISNTQTEFNMNFLNNSQVLSHLNCHKKMLDWVRMGFITD